MVLRTRNLTPKNYTTILIICLLTFLLNSCTSYFVRKDCEQLNWFDYGFQVAMGGKRLNSDAKLSECKKAEANINESQLDLGFKAGMANYCKNEIVFTTGKNGQFFNSELCDPGQLKQLTLKHQEGVLIFCEAKNGYTVGSKGDIYNQICPKNLEPAFLSEYKRGRKKFLNQSINENEYRISNIEGEISKLNHEKNYLLSELRTVEAVQLVRNTPSNQQVEDPVESKRKNLNYKITQQDSSIQGLENQKRVLQDTIYRQKKDLISLDE